MYEPRLLALAADQLVERERFADGEEVGLGVRADRLELPDVVVATLGRGLQRPDLGDLLLPHVQEPRTDGGVEPLVEAHRVVVAVEFGEGKVMMRHRVRAVDEDGNVVAARHLHDLAHGEDLPRDVDHVAHEDEARAIRDLLLEPPHDFGRILGGNRDLELLQDDPLAAFALLKGRDHAPVILRRRHDFVPALEVVAVLQDLESLRRVARDRDLLGVHVPLPGEPGADALPLRFQDLPPVVDRDLVGEVEVPLHRLEHVGGRRAHTPVVEVD